MPPYTGRCQCGAVKYKIIQPPITVHACYCTDCQKRSGSAFGISMVIAENAFILTGVIKSFEREADSGYQIKQCFCPECGNPIFGMSERRPKFIVLFAGTLDDTTWFKMERLIWTSRAQPWCPLPGNVEIFKESQPF